MTNLNALANTTIVFELVVAIATRAHCAHRLRYLDVIVYDENGTAR